MLEFLLLLDLSDVSHDSLLNLFCAFQKKNTLLIRNLSSTITLNNLFGFFFFSLLLDLSFSIASTQFKKWPARGQNSLLYYFFITKISTFFQTYVGSLNFLHLHQGSLILTEDLLKVQLHT